MLGSYFICTLAWIHRWFKICYHFTITKHTPLLNVDITLIMHQDNFKVLLEYVLTPSLNQALNNYANHFPEPFPKSFVKPFSKRFPKPFPEHSTFLKVFPKPFSKQLP